MTENTATAKPAETAKAADVKAATTVSETNKSYSEAEIKAMYDALPDMFKQAIDKVNSEIDAHNAKIDSVKAAEAKDPMLIKAEVFEQNPSNNKKIAAIYKEYLKLVEAAEKLKTQAYEVIETDGLMPKELTEAEIDKLKTEVTDSTKTLRDQVSALSQFEEMMPMLKGKILPLVKEIKTRRGTAKTGGSASKGEGPKRIRFKRIEVNNVVEDAQGNKVYGVVNGEEKYTFTFASQFLRKQHKGINWSANDLTDAYLKGQDENNLPEVREFVMPYTYKNNEGHDVTVEYKVKCFRP